jgi:hypothetical protein
MRRVVSVVLLKLIEDRDVNAEYDDASPQVLSLVLLTVFVTQGSKRPSIGYQRGRGSCRSRLYEHEWSANAFTVLQQRLTGGDNRAQTKPEHFNFDENFACINFKELEVVAKSL